MNRRNVSPLLCVLGFLLACSVARSQTQVAIAPVPKLQFLDVNGKPLAGGCVFTYAAGTTTPQAAYTDATGSTQNTNPVILDSGGRASIWLSSSAYKIAVWSSGGVSCASGVQQYSIDGITVANLNSANQLISAAANPAATGFIRMANGDLVNWRNIANSADIGFSQAGAPTTANGNLADVLRYGSATAGGLQAQRYLDFSTAPAQSGILATGNNVCAVASRNAAGNADVCLVQLNASNVTALGGSAGVSVAGPITISGNLTETTGTATVPALSVTNSIVNTAAFQRFRSSGTSCTTGSSNGNACNSSAITLPVVEPDTNYTVVCNTEGSNTGSPVIQGAGIKSTTTVVLSVVNTGNVASSYGTASCLVFHD